MKVLQFLLPALLATPSLAQDGEIRGRMICEVTSSRLVSEIDKSRPASASDKEDFSAGMTLYFEYALDGSMGLSISLGEPKDRSGLIDEPFSAETFSGISRFTNIAEFRAAYSEISFGKFGMNYKGSDQLLLRNRCGSRNWSGHFVRTQVSGQSTHVVSLECQPFIDAVDAVLHRLGQPE